ncbi:MAG: ribbon-helix-helix domain-containing protein [Alphaproteobacteria bacterium]|jgi:predicted DNA-binding ribbon-helix-helix protein
MNQASSPGTGSSTLQTALTRLAVDTPERKRSVVLAGHRTSVSVEQLYWDALRDAAASRKQSLNALVTDIDTETGGDGSLSSALRVFVLDGVRNAD